MEVITVKAKILQQSFIIQLSEALISLSPKSQKVKMVQVFEEAKEDVSDYFLFEKCEKGEWKLRIENSFVSYDSRIKSLYVELLMSNDLICLDDLLEGLRKINIEKGDIHVYLALLL